MANSDASTKPERSLNKQVILEEDEYTAALSQIIARDFFPSLVHLDATNEYLDAVRTRDPNLIAASVRKLEQVANTPLPSSSRRRAPAQTPGRTPYASFPSDTPFHHSFDDSAEGDERAFKRPRYDSSLSLDEFQARYTSEDNSSFTQILDEENRQRREKYGWAWEAQKKVEAQRERMIEARERMLIEPASDPFPGVKEKFRIEAPRPAGLITVSGEKEKETETGGEGEKGGGPEAQEKMAIILKATSVAEATEAVMAPRKDTRTAGVDGWKFRTRNSLMFSPDADVSPYHPPPKSNIESIKKSEQKIISYGNTRLVEDDHKIDSSVSSEPPSPTRSRIEAAISGTPYRPKSPSLSDINALVPNLPNPTPEQLGSRAVNQLMTWGTLNATPRVLSRPEDEEIIEPQTPFHIRDMSSRELLSRKLANTASKSLKAKAEMMGSRPPGMSRGEKRKGDMRPPTWTPRRAEAAGNLTPAARRLLERSTVGAASLKRGVGAAASGQERDLNRVRWTPTPASRRVG